MKFWNKWDSWIRRHWARRIWITRTEPGASATGARVRALGHEPLIAPLLAVQPLSDVVIDLAGVSTLAFTSANGVRAFVAASAARAFQVFAEKAGVTRIVAASITLLWCEALAMIGLLGLSR